MARQKATNKKEGKVKNKTSKRDTAKKEKVKDKTAKSRTGTVKKSVLQDAPVENYFVLCNGRPLKNIKELADVMDEIEDHVFDHHVREDHNDFVAWVEGVFKEAELAKELAGAKDKKHTQLVIYKHLAHKLN